MVPWDTAKLGCGGTLAEAESLAVLAETSACIAMARQSMVLQWDRAGYCLGQRFGTIVSCQVVCHRWSGTGVWGKQQRLQLPFEYAHGDKDTYAITYCFSIQSLDEAMLYGNGPQTPSVCLYGGEVRAAT